MKRTILMMVLAAVAMCGWAAGNGNKTLKVKLDIVDFGDTAVVYRSGHEEKTFIGKNGKFEFELEVDTLGEGLIVQPRLLRGDMESPRFYFVPLMPGEEMRLWDTDGNRYDIDGTGFYAEYHQVDLFNENAEKESSGYGRQFREMRENGTVSEEELTKFYNDIYEPSFDRYQEALFDYIKAHPKQEAAVWLLKSINGLDKKKEAYALFDVSVREGRMKSLYDSWIAAAEENERAEAEEKEAQKKQVAGIEAPVFTLNDINGKPLALTSLRGKYVILDFWGSWCVWCIKGFPKMKEYYAKYPGKFEILGVDCNDTEEKWKAAVKHHDLPWLHVYCPSESTVLADYGVTGFPTKIIIGPDGKIVRTIVGEDPSFYTLLDELFGQ